MVTRELVSAELERLNNEQLSAVYEFIKKKLPAAKPKSRKKSLMGGLKAIQIDAHEDFAENHDSYVTGEKRV